MAFPFLLLAAQAAGIALNVYASSRQGKAQKQGAAVEEQMIRQRMEQETIAATQENLSDLNNLRETLATQRAIFGARGQSPGQGTAKALEQRSVNQFGTERQAKEINQRFRQGYLESLSRLKKVESKGLQAQREMQLLGTSLNMVDFNTLYGLYNQATAPKKTTKVK